MAIDPEIGKAETLPSHIYTDPGVFVAQKESVFARTCQWVGDTTAFRGTSEAPSNLPRADNLPEDVQ